MFSLYDYPIQGKDDLSLCEEHGKKLEMLEVVIIDREATELSPHALERRALMVPAMTQKHRN